MTPKKPDRWERMVEDLEFIRNCGGKETPVCDSADVLILLRKEHAAVVRMVLNHLAKWTDRTGPDIDAQEAYGRHCRAVQCQEIIDQLKRRAK